MNLVNVKVIPRSRHNAVTLRHGEIICRVTVAPEDGKANEAVLALLADYWHFPVSRLRIVRGSTSHRKVIERPDVKTQ